MTPAVGCRLSSGKSGRPLSSLHVMGPTQPVRSYVGRRHTSGAYVGSDEGELQAAGNGEPVIPTRKHAQRCTPLREGIPDSEAGIPPFGHRELPFLLLLSSQHPSAVFAHQRCLRQAVRSLDAVLVLQPDFFIRAGQRLGCGECSGLEWAWGGVCGVAREGVAVLLAVATFRAVHSYE